MLPNALAASARARAVAENRPVLASFTERAPELDPLTILESAGSGLEFNGLSEHAAAGMMYWTRPDERFTLAGLGAVATLTAEGPGRFASIDRSWGKILNGSLANASTSERLPGPVLMGGFAFENAGPQSETWRNFPSAHFIVPRIQLTVADGKCWTTVSWMVAADGQPDMDIETLLTLRSSVLKSGTPALNGEMAIGDPAEVPRFRDSLPADAWREMVSCAMAAIRAGNLQKVVLARAVEATALRDLSVFELVRQLRASQESSFVFSYWRNDSAFVGASPERLVRLDGHSVSASSLAGTARRGATKSEDEKLAAELIASTKDQAEHAAVRNSLRRNLAEVCDDVVAAQTPTLLTLQHMHHLHTAVTGRLQSDNSLLDLVGRLHPTPAVGGSPSENALQFIHENEHLDRGWYAAPIGWVGRHAGEFAVALRSGVITGANATLFAGCGIVADSDPALELAESALKLQPMQSAIAAALVSPTSDSTIVAGSEQLQ
ncbi:MAG: isochorismate synthase [Gemmatimonadaceae bacterium]